MHHGIGCFSATTERCTLKYLCSGKTRLISNTSPCLIRQPRRLLHLNAIRLSNGFVRLGAGARSRDLPALKSIDRYNQSDQTVNGGSQPWLIHMKS